MSKEEIRLMSNEELIEYHEAQVKETYVDMIERSKEKLKEAKENLERMKKDLKTCEDENRIKTLKSRIREAKKYIGYDEKSLIKSKDIYFKRFGVEYDA